MEKELIIDVKSLSNEDLFEFQNFLDEQHEMASNELAEEIKKFAGENFDPFTYWNERKINKANAKFVKTFDAIKFWSKKVEDEIEYRKFVGQINEKKDEREMGINEFLITEHEKTEKLKAKKDQ